MSKKKKLIPDLRFPEFKDSGEWGVFKLGGILIKNSAKNRKLKYSLVQSVSNKHGFINQDEYFENRIVASKDTSNYYVIKNGCFAYNPSRIDVGSLAYKHDNETSIISPLYVSFRASNEKVLDLFLLNWFSSENFKKQMIFEGGVRNTLNYENLSEIRITLPAINEQQKIATCLSSLDNLIEAHSQKLDLLKDHKKGLMQNLFPQEGEKVPKLRFKEFKKDGPWERKQLEGLAKRGSGHTPNKQMPSYYDGGIKWVSLADSNKLDNRYIYDTKIHISKEGIENSSAVLHPAGAVILSRDAGVGKSAVLYSEMAVSQHFIVWTCNKSKLFNWYLYYVLQLLKPAFESIAVGSTIKTIGLPYFKELAIPVPSIKEQQKIASCLSSLDELITEQAEKIEQLKKHKMGLMQGLFPKMIE